MFLLDFNFRMRTFAVLAWLVSAAWAQTRLPDPLLSAERWRLGAVAGVNLANAEVDGFSSRTETGLLLGARVEWDATPSLGLMAEPKWVQKGADLQLPGALFDPRGQFHFIEFPLLAQVRWTMGRIGAHGVAGPVVGMRSAVSGQLQAGRSLVEGDINLLEFGGEAGAGINLALTGAIDLSLDARYGHGFRNLLNGSAGEIDHWRSRDIRIQVGLVFHPAGRRGIGP